MNNKFWSLFFCIFLVMASAAADTYVVGKRVYFVGDGKTADNAADAMKAREILECGPGSSKQNCSMKFVSEYYNGQANSWFLKGTMYYEVHYINPDNIVYGTNNTELLLNLTCPAPYIPIVYSNIFSMTCQSADVAQMIDPPQLEVSDDCQCEDIRNGKKIDDGLQGSPTLAPHVQTNENGGDGAPALSPRVGNPVVLAAGAKYQMETDYQNSKGTLRFKRVYRSDTNRWEFS